jgi:hypothetical protein
MRSMGVLVEVALLGAIASCGKNGSVPVVLPCNNTSVEELCGDAAPNSCDLTWSAVQTDTTLCPAVSNGLRVYEYDCDGFHVLLEAGIDGGGFSYYDVTSGALVAVVYDDNGMITCAAGPAAGFARPVCNNIPSAAGPPPPLPQCMTDGGSEGGISD